MGEKRSKIGGYALSDRRKEDKRSSSSSRRRRSRSSELTSNAD